MLSHAARLAAQAVEGNPAGTIAVGRWVTLEKIGGYGLLVEPHNSFARLPRTYL